VVLKKEDMCERAPITSELFESLHSISEKISETQASDIRSGGSKLKENARKIDNQ
jgi:hypothetical protein